MQQLTINGFLEYPDAPYLHLDSTNARVPIPVYELVLHPLIIIPNFLFGVFGHAGSHSAPALLQT